ncbi:MAG: DedA family protein [Chlamydiales bacterium]|nr:DedA family protein [Chlamydiia bacterium]MCP5507732.1 DedA family protein [Chlamydiales bacterium]
MESLFDSLCLYADQAHWIIFLLLMLAGLNFPISEDILLLTGGAIASTCIPESTYYLYAWIYMGCWISAWEVYWIGRLLGPKLYRYQWFLRFVNPERVEKLHYYYEKFGVWTFIVGRFIPGGVRNALFMSAGLGKMPFVKFILRDGFACIFSSATLFTIGYQFGKNYKIIVDYIKTYNLVIIGIIITIILIFAGYHWTKGDKKTTSQ